MATTDVRVLGQRFERCEPESVLWAEKAAYENLKQRIDTGAAFASQAGNTLTLLLAGLGAALAVGVRVLQTQADMVAWGAGLVCLYFALLATLLLRHCISALPQPMLYNEPTNLLMPGQDLAQVRAYELANVQKRIDEQADINQRRAFALNKVRFAAAATPLIFAIGAASARWAGLA